MGLCGGYISSWWLDMNQLSCWQVGWGTATLAGLSWESEVIAEPVRNPDENGSVVGRIHNWPPHATTRTISNNFEVEIHHTCHIILGVKFSQLEFNIVQPLSNLERHAQTWPITVPILVKLGDPNPGTANAPAIPNGSGPKSSKSTEMKELPWALIPGGLKTTLIHYPSSWKDARIKTATKLLFRFTGALLSFTCWGWQLWAILPQ